MPEPSNYLRDNGVELGMYLITLDEVMHFSDLNYEDVDDLLHATMKRPWRFLTFSTTQRAEVQHYQRAEVPPGNLPCVMVPGPKGMGLRVGGWTLFKPGDMVQVTPRGESTWYVATFFVTFVIIVLYFVPDVRTNPKNHIID